MNLSTSTRNKSYECLVFGKHRSMSWFENLFAVLFVCVCFIWTKMALALDELQMHSERSCVKQNISFQLCAGHDWMRQDCPLRQRALYCDSTFVIIRNMINAFRLLSLSFPSKGSKYALYLLIFFFRKTGMVNLPLIWSLIARLFVFLIPLCNVWIDFIVFSYILNLWVVLGVIWLPRGVVWP